jgi:ABC-type phosphate transport system substrate-binding protein
MRITRLVTTLLCCATLLASVLAHAAAETSATPPFRVIVDPNNAATQLDREFLADVFLKKATRWRNGEVTYPVDLSSKQPARREFSEQVLKRSVEAVRSYWQQLIFAGRDVPPPELENDEAVIKYVLAHPGAVGYVSGSAQLGAAKAVTVK